MYMININYSLVVDSELMKVMIKVVAAKGYNTFIQILSTFYSENCYKEFVESIVLFYSIHENGEYIKTSVNIDLLIVTLTEHNLFATKEVAQTLSNDKNAVQLRAHVGLSREEYLLDFMIKGSPDFHKQFLECILQPSFCILHLRIMRCINKVQKDILNTVKTSVLGIMRCINKMQKDILNTVKTSVLATNSSQSVMENSATPMSLLPVCSLPSSCSSDLTISLASNLMTHQVQPVLSQFRNCLSDKPVFSQLVEHVLPLHASQWKTLGTLLGVPVYELDSIEKSRSFQVKDCCYDMFGEWLKINSNASWGAIFSALDSSAMCCVNIGDNNSPSFFLKNYETYLRKLYTRSNKVETDERLPNPHDVFINLELVKLHKNMAKAKMDHSILFSRVKWEREQLKTHEKIFNSTNDIGRQVILIEGNAGTGKTTLAHKVCKEWAKEMILKRTSHLILLRLRDNRIGNVESLEVLIRLFCGTEADDIARGLRSTNGHGIVIWLEGWDELPNDRRQDSIFTDLISGQLLPQAIVVITTRPSATISIQDNFITRRIEILGFTAEQVDEYIDYCFQKDQDSCNKFKNQLNKLHNLKSLTSIPLNLKILTRVFFVSNLTLPCTITEVYRAFLLNILQRYKQKMYSDVKPLKSICDLSPEMKKQLNGLEKLSFDSLCKNQLTFTEEEISTELFNDETVPLEFDGMGLFQIHHEELLTGITVSYNFHHKTLQELLAAQYLSGIESYEQHKRMLEKIFEDMRFEMVWLFYAGITGFRLVSIANLLPDVPGEVKPCVHFENMRCCTIVNNKYYDYFETLTVEYISEEFLMVLVNCCYEADSPFLCQIISNHFYGKLCYMSIPDHCTPHSIVAISYFITYSRKKWIVATVQDYHLKDFCVYFESPNSVPWSLEMLHCAGFNTCMATLIKLLQTQHCLKFLVIQSFTLDDDNVQLLCDYLKQNTSITYLTVDECDLSGRKLAAVGNMLALNSTIIYLFLCNSQFTINDFIYFIELIKDKKSLEQITVEEKICNHPEVKKCLQNLNHSRNFMLKFFNGQQWILC